VYAHGLGGSSLNWTDLMARLRGSVDGWSLDLGGFGMSPPPRDGDLTPAGHARSMAELIEHLGLGPAHVFGNSMGGSVALQLAARRPDLVRSLTLISPALPSVFATKSNVHLPVIAVPGIGERLVPKYLETDAGARVRGTIDVCFAEPSRVSPIRMAEAVDEVTSRDHLTYASDAFLRSLRGLLRTFVDVGPNRPWKLAERVTCPTLVIYGRKDPLVDPRNAHRVTKHFRDAHVVVLPDSGHVAQMEHPEFVAAAWERFIASGR
jgi:pimeloyl-ACP methyl ester carboxylesterase